MFINTMDGEGFEATAGYLEGIDTEGVKNCTLHDMPNGEKLEVAYEDGSTVWYENVHGTWGFPIKVE